MKDQYSFSVISPVGDGGQVAYQTVMRSENVLMVIAWHALAEALDMRPHLFIDRQAANVPGWSQVIAKVQDGQIVPLYWN